MRNLGRGIVTALVVAALLAPLTAGATNYEDRLGECSYPKFFDLAFMRPISFAMLVGGTMMFVPVAPWSLLTTRSVAAPFRTLVAAPAQFTFVRELGECPARDTAL